MLNLNLLILTFVKNLQNQVFCSPVQEACLAVEQDRLELFGQSDRTVGPAPSRSGFRFVLVGVGFVSLKVFQLFGFLAEFQVVVEKVSFVEKSDNANRRIKKFSY